MNYLAVELQGIASRKFLSHNIVTIKRLIFEMSSDGKYTLILMKLSIVNRCQICYYLPVMISRVEVDVLPQENKERFIQEHGHWEAGLLSAGGKIEIDPIIEDSAEMAAACVTFPDNDYTKVQKLLKLMGGRIYSSGKGEGSEYNWTWRLETPGNVWPLIVTALPHMPAYSYYAEYGKTWSHMTDGERFRAARRAQIRVTAGDIPRVPAQTYRHLVTDPRFVAGAAVDARTSLFVGHEYEKHAPTIEMASGNISLMEALQGQFGGELKEKVSGQTGKHTTVWQLGYVQGKNLYNFVWPHLLLRAGRAAEVFKGRRQ